MKENQNKPSNLKAEDVVKKLKELKNEEKMEHRLKYFKTQKGEYGEGDIFLGLTVPQQRRVADDFKELSLKEIKKLIANPFHESRFTALIILIKYFNKGNEQQKKDAVDLYLNSTSYINNWDLVDVSAHKILGPWLENQKRDILYKFAESELLWEQRISILTTMHFVKKGEVDDCLAISKKLLHHEHDLIHKAVGWLLREVGKQDKSVLDDFLNKYSKEMPRTMLRYAIEKYPENERKEYLKKKRNYSGKKSNKKEKKGLDFFLTF